MLYQDFIEDARNYTKIFEYHFSIKQLSNKWMLLATALVLTGLYLYISTIPEKFTNLKDMSGMLLGLLLIFSAAYFRSKFDESVLSQKLIDIGIINTCDHKLTRWRLKKLYLEQRALRNIKDVRAFIDIINDIEIKISESQGIVKNMIGTSLLDGLFSFKGINNRAIFTLGIAGLGAIGGMYLESIKEQITSFYESPFEFMAFYVLLVAFSVLILFFLAFLLMILGFFVVRHHDLHGKIISRQARHQYRLDLLMFADCGVAKEPSLKCKDKLPRRLTTRCKSRLS
jgi:hypothetical protein